MGTGLEPGGAGTHWKLQSPVSDGHRLAMIRLTRALRSLHLRHAIAFLFGVVDRFLLPVWAELEEEVRLSGGMIERR